MTELDWEAIEKCRRGLPDGVSQTVYDLLSTHEDEETYTWLLNLWASDQRLYQLGLDYSSMSVQYHRALYRLRVIAGFVPDDPNTKRDPSTLAQEWLVEHDLVAEQPVLPFLKETTE
ncbi:hypothetical protein KAR91_72100 [Candidatus Pacearchaeota archaeon]|nr:hypothetical protein [Candidatus Pacearchaeota archaeon]